MREDTTNLVAPNLVAFRGRDAADLVDFGALPPAVNNLLQQGVAAYRTDAAAADALFRAALAQAPTQLPIYFCLYKTHTYRGNLDAALAAARAGAAEAARQAGWPTDWRDWPARPAIDDGPGRFALYTLKAMAFIHLRRQEAAPARRLLAALARFDPAGLTGWPVVVDLAHGVADPTNPVGDDTAQPC